MAHRYYGILRPPSWGGSPDKGRVAMEAWSPTQAISSANSGKADEALYGLRTHGWAEYETPLPLDVAWKYDLLPADAVQRAWYYLYQDARNSRYCTSNEDAAATTLRRAERYREAPVELLEDLEPHLAWVAETLRAHPDSVPTFKG